MKILKVWLGALRLKTLPLAASSIIVSAAIAINLQIFNLRIFILTMLTAILLQILSNLANDHGDAISGADSQNRIGPKRAMQSGLITKKQMTFAIIICTSMCFISGGTLLFFSIGDDLFSWILFLLLGFLSIIAALTYTIGKNPYGYRALGDLSVFIFFGLIGVIGSFYLYDLTFRWDLLLPAISIGFFSAAVLNINNIRDVYSDKDAKKITLVVKHGRKKAFIYHKTLIVLGILSTFIYFCLLPDVQPWQFIFLLAGIPFIRSIFSIKKAIEIDTRDGDLFNNELKNTSISTFLFSIFILIALF